MIKAGIMKIYQAKDSLLELANNSFLNYREQLDELDDRSGKQERDELISLKNEETNKVVKKLITSGTMENCSLKHIYGAFLRLNNSLYLLSHYDEDYSLLLMTEKDFYNNPLLGIDLTSGVAPALIAVPSDQVHGLLSEIFPQYVPMVDI